MTTPQRSTGSPCPCGSGLEGLRNLRLDCTHYIACPKCYVEPQAKTYREIRDDEARRQTVARRRLEERREMAGAGELW